MYYVEEVRIPPQTSRDDAIRTVMELSVGTIQRVRVCFPPGCCSLVHVQILRHEHQLYPTTPGSSFAWDGYVIEFVDSYPLDEAPYELKLVTWNDDDSYYHTIQVQIEVAEYDIVRLLVDLMKKGLGGIFGIGTR